MKKTFFLLFAAGTLFTACQSSSEKEAKTAEVVAYTPIEIKDEASGISLLEVVSTEFNDAKLLMNSPIDSVVADTTVSFSFAVENYELGAQTKSSDHCANSGKGQHIHLILNNEPYTAHYEADFTKNLKEGNYLALAFLSRSYHESIKTKDAYVLKQFSIGEYSGEKFNVDQEHIIYSRPKGLYKGEDTSNVLLDFYLLNTDLSASGNKVKVTINNAAVFMIEKWAGYFIKGLKRGTNGIKLELIGPDGKLVQGPFNTVERTIIIEDDSMDNTLNKEIVKEELEKVNS